MVGLPYWADSLEDLCIHSKLLRRRVQNFLHNLRHFLARGFTGIGRKRDFQKFKHRNILIIANAFALVLTLQRTMIIAGLCILVYKSFNKGKAGGKTFVAPLAYFSTLLGISLNYGFLVFFSEFRDASSTYTFGWRVEHWKDRLNTDRSFLDWLVGSILGPNGLTDPTVFRITSHNLYVDVLEFYGIFGLLTFLFLVISRFHGATPVNEKVTTSEITLVLIIFSVSYTPTPICFLLWGLICSKRYINNGYFQRW